MLYNWKIIGHEKQLSNIERDIKEQTLAHAYLFAGPPQIGKFTIAKMFANILQCDNNLCNSCPTCIQMQKFAHPETFFLKNDGESIKLTEVKEIMNRLHMRSQGKYKIVVAQGIERMTTEAANSLLKILEEPGENTIFIFTTSNVQEVLPTIISRIRLIKFSAYSADFLKENLKPLFPDVDEETISEICGMSLGKSGKAIHLLEDPELLSQHKNMYNTLLELIDGAPLYKRFAFAQELTENPDQLNDFFEILTYITRKMLFKEALSTKKDAEKIEKYVDLLQKINQYKGFLKRNINVKLTIENLLLQFN